jgi:DNA-binding response OmpR family regulator
VFIVDGDLDSREATQWALARERVTLSAFECGEAAIKVARGRPPAVIVTALWLPGMSGLELAISLREDVRTSGVRVLALTGACHIEAALFDAVLRKPTSLAALTGAVTALVEPSWSRGNTAWRVLD